MRLPVRLPQRRIGLNGPLTKMFARAGRSAVLLALAIIPNLVDPAIASPDQNLEICHRATALGYDASKEPVIGHQMLSKLERCTKAFWAKFKPRPLDEILNDADQAAYHKAIDQGDCISAQNLLRQHFSRAHPEAPSVHFEDMMFDYWGHNMERNFYPSLGLCRDLKTIRTSLKAIAREGIKARPFWSMQENFYPRSTQYPFHLRQMYAGVANMIFALGLTQSPKVALGLLRLSREGQAVKFHPHYELYLAFRLKGFSVEDPLLDTVIGKPTDPTVRARIAEQARQKNSTGIPMFPK